MSETQIGAGDRRALDFDAHRLCFCFWLCLAMVCAAPATTSAAQELRFDSVQRIGVEEGLSHSAVWHIHQDRRGFLWFATSNGLDRYDGYEFRTYRHDPDDPSSPSANEAMSIFEDRDGHLWLSTRSRGINRFDPSSERFTRYEYVPGDPTSLSANRVGGIYQDRRGNLWVGSEAGLDRFDFATESFEHIPHDPDRPESRTDAPVWVIEEAPDGTLWLGTIGGGVERFHPEDGTFRHYRHDPQNAESLISDLVFALKIDRNGALWVGTIAGVSRLDPGSDTFTHYTHDPADPRSIAPGKVPCIYETSTGDLFLCGSNGLSRFERSAGQDPEGSPEGGWFSRFVNDPKNPYSLSSNDFTSILEDQTGVLWLGTKAGLNKVDPRREQLKAWRSGSDVSKGIDGTQVLALEEDRDGVLWVGSSDRGLTALDRETGNAVRYRAGPNAHNLSSDSVTSVIEDREGELWIGTLGGLHRLDRERRVFSRYLRDPKDSESLVNNLVSALLEDQNEIHFGDIWVGTQFGLQRFDRDRRAFIRYLFDPEQPRAKSIDGIYGLYQDSSGDVWAATFGGLVYLPVGLDPDSQDYKVWLHEPMHAESLSNNEVTSMLEDSKGRFWVGTSGGGLNLMDRSAGTFRSFRVRDGLPSDGVVGLVQVSDGTLWISTEGGLSHFDPSSETFRNLDLSDGLHSNAFYIGPALVASDGELFFGGEGGMTSFYPDRLTTDSQPPRVVLTDFRLLNERVQLQHRDQGSPLDRSITETDRLTLDYQHRVVSFSFAALHFADPARNRYRYQLQGFDEHWVETDANRRFAQYTNLDPGDYVFRVQGANKEGLWSPDEASVRIAVRPPPWATWWAYCLYALALISVAGLYLHSHRRELRREREAAERERAVARRLREVDKLKDEFLANTSHELRTPLFGMTGLAESMLGGAAGPLSETARGNLSMIVASGKRLAHLVNDILDFSKLRHKSLELDRHAVELHAVVDIVLTLSQPLVGDKELELVNAVPSDLPAAEADENRLQQILYNLIGNAVKFTDGGRVEVSALVENESLLIEVRDTGIGIPEHKLETVFNAFEQADASIEREYGGTGLGLAVTRRLVELHGGTLWVRSTEGEGSSFFFSLPRAEGSMDSVVSSSIGDPAPQPPSARELPQSPEPGLLLKSETEDPSAVDVSLHRGAPIRVLAVDDEPINLQVLKGYLSLEHLELTTVSNGGDALRLIQEERFDLVLLDVMMPKISGFEVCRNLRQIHKMENLPVLFLTAKKQEGDVVTGLSLGANDYLTKPIARDELLARIRPHLALLDVNRRLEVLVEDKISQIKVLEGVLPICSGCKRIRDGESEDEWVEMEEYIHKHSEAEFTHGLCPQCLQAFLGDGNPSPAGSEPVNS